MNSRFCICKCISPDYADNFYAVIDYHRDLLIRWCYSYEVARELCDFLNKENADYE